MPENACITPHPQNTPTLETERLRLRRFRPDDLDALLAIYGDEEANVFLPWYPVRSKEEARPSSRSATPASTASPAGTPGPSA